MKFWMIYAIGAATIVLVLVVVLVLGKLFFPKLEEPPRRPILAGNRV
jgi:hypothetical protein